jgi:hypothetical protein
MEILTTIITPLSPLTDCNGMEKSGGVQAVLPLPGCVREYVYHTETEGVRKAVPELGL